MQKRITPLSRYLWQPLGLALLLGVAPIISVPVAQAQSGNTPRSQTVYLPDPTPRQVDPHLLLKDDQQAGTSTQEAVEHRNQKRRELIVWAANELVTLSERLQAEVKTPPADGPKTDAAATGASLANAAANAQRIEQLANSLTAALKAP